MVFLVETSNRSIPLFFHRHPLPLCASMKTLCRTFAPYLSELPTASPGCILEFLSCGRARSSPRSKVCSSAAIHSHVVSIISSLYPLEDTPCEEGVVTPHQAHDDPSRSSLGCVLACETGCFRNRYLLSLLGPLDPCEGRRISCHRQDPFFQICETFDGGFLFWLGDYRN